MKNVFSKEDVLTSEMDDLLGGFKIKVKITRPDGTTYEAEVDI